MNITITRDVAGHPCLELESSTRNNRMQFNALEEYFIWM